MLIMIDLDNTLADREAAVRAWIAEFCEQESLPDDARSWILATDNDGYSARADVLQAIKDRFALSTPLDQFLADYQKRVVELNVPVAGAVECLQVLRELGWPLAIVSNGSSKQQHSKIDHLGLRDLVDAVVVSGDLGIKKPAPAIFEVAATELGVSFDGGWMVGDSATHDIVGAAALGLQTAWISRGRVWPSKLPPPTAALDSLYELAELVGEPPRQAGS